MSSLITPPFINWLRLRVLLLNLEFVNVASLASQLSLETSCLSPRVLES